MKVSKSQIRKARNSNIFGYLIRFHKSDIIGAGAGRIRLNDYHSLVVTRGIPIYCRNSTGEHGNPIELLRDYFGYTFVDAVIALSQFADAGDYEYDFNRELKIPERADIYDRAAKYLTETRGIDSKLVSRLMKDGLIYQEQGHNNICFENGNYIELHGSLSYKSFKGIAAGSDSDGYWAFGFTDKPKEQSICYVCESAIDAMSLYCIMNEAARRDGAVTPKSYFASMGGLKQGTLDRIRKEFKHVILAVDNDSVRVDTDKDAGKNFCNKLQNSLLLRKIPNKKDWNEDLLAIRQLHS
nr:toprim domain-containing protein [uncultured Anaerosporobacter sp.]